MTRIELTPPSSGDVPTIFERACVDLGLRAHRGTLKQYDECTHWHVTRPGEKGTLEATWWPTNHALWLEIRGNRQADWMVAVVADLKARF